MSLDRHGCKLHLDWCAEAYNYEVVILVYEFIKKKESCEKLDSFEITRSYIP